MKVAPNIHSNYPWLTWWLVNNFPKIRSKKPNIWEVFKKHTRLNEGEARKATNPLSGGSPTLKSANAGPRTYGWHRWGTDSICIADWVCKRFEKDFPEPSSLSLKIARLTEQLVLEELVEWAHDKNGLAYPKGSDQGAKMVKEAYDSLQWKYW